MAEKSLKNFFAAFQLFFSFSRILRAKNGGRPREEANDIKTKSMSKRLLAIFLAVLMIGSAFVWTASAAGEEWDAANATDFVFSDEGIAVTEGA